MSQVRGSLPGGLLATAILFGLTLSAAAGPPSSGKKTSLPGDEVRIAKRKTAPPPGSSRSASPAPQLSARRPVVARQLGFEAQQQGYLAKVQGASSQNVIWVLPRPQPPGPKQTNFLDALRDFFD